MPPLFAASGGGGHSRCGHRAALALGENAEAVDCKYLIPRKFPEIMTANRPGGAPSNYRGAVRLRPNQLSLANFH
jgi:hypothetical protein